MVPTSFGVSAAASTGLVASAAAESCRNVRRVTVDVIAYLRFGCSPRTLGPEPPAVLRLATAGKASAPEYTSSRFAEVDDKTFR